MPIQATTPWVSASRALTGPAGPRRPTRSAARPTASWGPVASHTRSTRHAEQPSSTPVTSKPGSMTRPEPAARRRLSTWSVRAAPASDAYRAVSRSPCPNGGSTPPFGMTTLLLTFRLLVGFPLRAAQPADLGVDEVVDVALEHRLGLRGLVARARVLHHLVGVKDVVADLRAPGAAAVAPEVIQFPGLLLAAALKQLGLQDRHRGGAVLNLGPLVLAGDDDAGRQVGDPDRGVGGVNALTTWAG